MIELFKLLWNSLGVTQITNFFTDDAHYIISGKGRIKLSKIKNER